MPRYFFHVFDDLSLRDRDGIVLDHPGAACAAALDGARGMMCDQVKKGRLSLHHRIEVEGEGGERILTLSFGDAVEVEIADPN